jgi:hypothetical protein
MQPIKIAKDILYDKSLIYDIFIRLHLKAGKTNRNKNYQKCPCQIIF